MDDSVHAIHLSLNLLNGSHPVDSLTEISELTKLAIVNYSCSGWSLRLQLAPDRKWLLADNQVIEFDLS